MGENVTAVYGPNGIGKTNLAESLYFAFTSRSFRTTDRRDLVPFGGGIARVRAEVTGEDDVAHEFMCSYGRQEGSRLLLDGAAAGRDESAAFRPAVAVFSPDRLEIVKGPPAVRRSHLDAFIATRWPSRSGLRAEYGRALAQRNALLSSIAEGASSPAQLDTWDAQLSSVGSRLASARLEAVEELSPPYRQAALDLGLEGGNDLIYRAPAGVREEDIREGLQQRREADVAARRTTWGPHHDELRLELDGRQLRRFGSQGQQRLGLLSLMFAERLVLAGAGRPVPLMVLDDVMSELDSTRRENLVKLLGTEGQALVTAAEETLIPDSSGVTRLSMEELLGAATGTPREDAGEAV